MGKPLEDQSAYTLSVGARTENDPTPKKISCFRGVGRSNHAVWCICYHTIPNYLHYPTILSILVPPTSKIKYACATALRESLATGTDLNDAKAEFAASEQSGAHQNDHFRFVDCINDEMLVSGDKFGNPMKWDVQTPISVIRYDKVVENVQQQPMTQEVCFSFCQRFENIKYFGLVGSWRAGVFDVLTSRTSSCTRRFRRSHGHDWDHCCALVSWARLFEGLATSCVCTRPLHKILML